MMKSWRDTMSNVAWKFASNHLNMALISSIGMIPSASILQKKYYKDSLSWFDGYIPVFKKVPDAALEDVIEEEKNILKPCVVLFKKNLIDTLKVQGVTELPALINGNWQIIATNDKEISKVDMLLLPAPISLSNVDKILFKNQEDKMVFDDRLADSNNSSGLSLISKVSEKEFFGNNKHSIQYYQTKGLFDVRQPSPLNFDMANAMVSIINHLVILSATNQNADKLLTYIKSGQSFFDGEDKNTSLLLEIGDWIRTLGKSTPISNTGTVFITLCQKLILHKHDFNYASYKDIVLVSLEELSNNNEQSLDFVKTVRRYLQFSNHSVQHLLEQYPQHLRRAIILFVSKDDVLELWNKIGIYNAVESFDMLLASILFAVSKGWQGLSREFKFYANNLMPMQNLLVLFSKNISIQINPSAISSLNLPLEGVWQGNYQGRLKKTVISLITHYQLDCASDEFLLPEGVELNARGGKILIKTKAHSIKISTIIDEPKFLEYLSGLNWFDFKQDEVLQRLLSKK